VLRFAGQPGEGVLRVPAAGLQITGLIGTSDPTWYVVLQAVVGMIQFATAMARRAGRER
jgi:hypothetical protein